MSNRSIITYRNFDGSAELSSIWDVFSGTTIARGETTPTNTFRVYNNYSGASDVVTADRFQLIISTDDRFIVYDQRTSYEDFTRNLVNGGHIELRCTISSEFGVDPDPEWYIFSGAVSGSTFDKITAISGSDNFNEYEMRIHIPASGTGNSFYTSGSAAPTIFAKWHNLGIDQI